MFARFLRWLTILEVRLTFWKFGMSPCTDARQRWRNYIATGDARKTPEEPD